jgi:uncharacterized protein (TIGR02147 family)
MQNIEYYSDYRTYLEDYYREQKKRFSHFSFRYFCQKAGIQSPSLYKEVVEGKRNLSEKTAVAFAKGMGLTDREASFFLALVGFCQGKNSARKQMYLETMRRLRQPVKQRLVPVDEYAYYSQWYNPVIRELAVTLDWKEDFSLLARTVVPAVTARQARQSVATLQELGYLMRGTDGRWIQTEPALTTGSEVVSEGIRELNRQMSRLGVESIDLTAPTRRDVSNAVIGISLRSYEQIKQEILAFKRRVFQIVEDDHGADSVYGLNVQLFPLSAPQQEETDGTH